MTMSLQGLLSSFDHSPPDIIAEQIAQWKKIAFQSSNTFKTAKLQNNYCERKKMRARMCV